ncbi:MAG TPA: dihydropteroate synthase, partial [Bacillus bacterium]|nr:dihydropteroate synthase [Bacillus sp. (in: firmicutes)]
MIWQTARFAMDLSRPRIMGIVNATPDSFSDGGLHATA